MTKYLDCENCYKEQARFTILVGRTGDTEYPMCAKCVLNEARFILDNPNDFTANYVQIARD